MNHLSNPGTEIKRDSLSSGERTGRSPNHFEWGCRTAIWQRVEVSRITWEGESESVKATYAKIKTAWQYPEYGGARETLSESGSTTIQG